MLNVFRTAYVALRALIRTTGTCCRKCLSEWHGIEKEKNLAESQIDYIVCDNALDITVWPMKTKTRVYVLVTIVAAAVILWSVLASFSQNLPQYDIINLGNFGRDHIEPHAINDHGQIVGYFAPLNALSDGLIRPFVYDDVSGFNVLDKRCATPWALDINNRGQVVGGDASSASLATGSLFLWDPESGTT